MLTHKFNHSFGVNIRTEFSSISATASFGGIDVWILVSFIACGVAGLKSGPHGPVVKAVLFQCIGSHPEIIELPFAHGTGGIAQSFHEAGKSGVFFFLPVKISHAPAGNIPVADPAGTKGILAGKQGCTGGGAGAHGIGILEFHASFGEGIDVWGFNFVRPVTTDPVLAQVINHDEKNIWLFWAGCFSRNGSKRAGE